jgi:hypothetical protein
VAALALISGFVIWIASRNHGDQPAGAENITSDVQEPKAKSTVDLTYRMSAGERERRIKDCREHPEKHESDVTSAVFNHLFEKDVAAPTSEMLVSVIGPCRFKVEGIGHKEKYNQVYTATATIDAKSSYYVVSSLLWTAVDACTARPPPKIGNAYRGESTCWGRPIGANRTTTTKGEYIQWIFEAGRYAYTLNNTVVSIQDVH